MNPELKEYLDAWSASLNRAYDGCIASLDAVHRSMDNTLGCVTTPVMATSDMAGCVTEPMDSKLQAGFDKWEASFDALYRYLEDATTPTPASTPTITTDGVVGPVPANSSTAKIVTATVVATDFSSSTTQAQEAPAVAHDAPPVCIEMVPVTCSMACPTQVVTNTTTVTSEVDHGVVHISSRTASAPATAPTTPTTIVVITKRSTIQSWLSLSARPKLCAHSLGNKHMVSVTLLTRPCENPLCKLLSPRCQDFGGSCCLLGSFGQATQVPDSAARHIDHILLQSYGAEIYQLLTQPGEYLNFWLQPKPPWLSILTKSDTEVEERGEHPHEKEIKYVQLMLFRLLLRRPYSELPISRGMEVAALFLKNINLQPESMCVDRLLLQRCKFFPTWKLFEVRLLNNIVVLTPSVTNTADVNTATAVMYSNVSVLENSVNISTVARADVQCASFEVQFDTAPILSEHETVFLFELELSQAGYVLFFGQFRDIFVAALLKNLLSFHSMIDIAENIALLRLVHPATHPLFELFGNMYLSESGTSLYNKQTELAPSDSQVSVVELDLSACGLEVEVTHDNLLRGQVSFAPTILSFAWANLICFPNSEMCALLSGLLLNGTRITSEMSNIDIRTHAADCWIHIFAIVGNVLLHQLVLVEPFSPCSVSDHGYKWVMLWSKSENKAVLSCYLTSHWHSEVVKWYMESSSFVVIWSGFATRLWPTETYSFLDDMKRTNVPSSYDCYVNDACFFNFVQDHLNHGCYCDDYHGDSGIIKDLQAPWDPGVFFVATAWGQAVFQEGRDVSDPFTMRPGHRMFRTKAQPTTSPSDTQTTYTTGNTTSKLSRRWITNRRRRTLLPPWLLTSLSDSCCLHFGTLVPVISTCIPES